MKKGYERMKWQGRGYERGSSMSYEVQITKRGWIWEKGGMWKKVYESQTSNRGQDERGGMWKVLWQSNTK
jgi:hypothetical protein